jgi:uncharacterized protein YqgC (DUF456 family)
MNPAPLKLQPALFGGLFIGVLSALPFVNLGNCLCCMWVVAGGALATYLMQQNHPYPVTAADGALAGLLAGLIGGVVGALIAIPIQMAIGPLQQRLIQQWVLSNQDVPPETRTMIENMAGRGTSGILIGIQLVFSVCVGAVFGLLGGLLGVALFKKKDLPPPPGTVEILPPASPPGF